jgi:hypothetical protein
MNDGTNVFVFGSNLEGRHGKGAAYEAHIHWGAVRGVGAGPTGMAYALPTKSTPRQTLSLEEISKHVEEFLVYVKQHPELTFLVTKVGCGLAGFSESQIAPMFAHIPTNCILPAGWRYETGSHFS